MQQEKRKTWVVSRQGSGCFSKEYGGRVDLILNSFKKLRAVDGKAWNCCWCWLVFLLTLCAVKTCSL